jgi:hypothetical protein
LQHEIGLGRVRSNRRRLPRCAIQYAIIVYRSSEHIDKRY